MSEESRLGREAIETAYALKQLITAGVRVFFYLEDRERTLDSPTDKLLMREILHRELYRGELVWNKTKKRDQWGRKQQRPRPASEWMRQSDATLRIVSNEQWDAAHARLDAARKTYLRGTRGELWGRPATGLVGKYLLTGLARCGCCGGGLIVRAATMDGLGATAIVAAYHMRGRAVCANRLEARMADADRLVLDAIEHDVYAPGRGSTRADARDR